MIHEQEIISRLKRMLSKERFVHTLGVKSAAVELAKRFGCNLSKASTAALLHDCARDISSNLLLKLAYRFDILVDGIFEEHPQLLHGPVGAVISRKVFGVDDEQILRAISIHTTGDVNMTKLDKIIYIADYIEPNRDFPGVDKLRKTAFSDLDKSVLMALNNTIEYVINRNTLLHPKTVQARNFLLVKQWEQQRGERR